MKNRVLFFVLSFMIFTSSCRTEGNLMLKGDASDREYYKKTVTSSFVQLKNGKRIAISGTKPSELLQPVREPAKVKVLDDTSIRGSDIMSVVTPDNWYSIVSVTKKRGKGQTKDFVPMDYKGSHINYYVSTGSYSLPTYESNFGGSGHASFGSSSHISHSYYIQQGDSGALKTFDYANLRKMIPKTDPANKYLVKYRTNKTINNSVRWAGLGTIVLGLALACSGNDAYLSTGWKMMPVGIGVLTFGGIMQSKNIKHNLHGAFYRYNSVSVP